MRPVDESDVSAAAELDGAVTMWSPLGTTVLLVSGGCCCIWVAGRTEAVSWRWIWREIGRGDEGPGETDDLEKV